MIDIEKIKAAALAAINGYTAGNFVAPEAVLELITRLESAERDAERYRWLKDTASNWIKADVDIDTFMNHPHDLSYQQSLDIVTGAAMKEKL